MEADDRQSPFGSTRAEERISRRESPMISQRAASRCASGERGSGPAIGSTSGPISWRTAKATEPIHFASIYLRANSHGRKIENFPSGPLAAPPERPMTATVQPVTPIARGETADIPAVPTHSAEVSQLPAKDTRYATEPRGASSLAAATQRREGQPLERPALRLAILRPINTAVATVQRKESGPVSSATSGFSMAETNDLRGPEYSLVEEQSAFQPRLVSSGSSSQRQEVRGGFPVSVRAEVRDEADISSDDLVGMSVRDTSAFRNDGATESRSLVSSRPAEVPEPADIPPIALPGVQIRLLKPDESASTTPPSGNNVAEGGRSAIEISKPKAPVPAAPPPLDINAVADKVYQTLQRRFQLERERRGLY